MHGICHPEASLYFSAKAVFGGEVSLHVQETSEKSGAPLPCSTRLFPTAILASEAPRAPHTKQDADNRCLLTTMATVGQVILIFTELLET